MLAFFDLKSIKINILHINSSKSTFCEEIVAKSMIPLDGGGGWGVPLGMSPAGGSTAKLYARGR